MAKKNAPADGAAAPEAPVQIPVRMREDAKAAWTHAGQPVKPGDVLEVDPDTADRLIAQGIAEIAQPA